MGLRCGGGSGGNSSHRRIRSQVVFGGSQSAEVGGLVEGGVPVPEDGERGLVNVEEHELEGDSLNLHPCMLNILAVIDKVSCPSSIPFPVELIVFWHSLSLF